MTNFLDKARTGRTKALAGSTEIDRNENTPLMLGKSVQFKTSLRTNPVPFISTRAQQNTSAWLH